MQPIRIALAQTNVTVGALRENRERLLLQIEAAADAGARIVVFPELVLTGYPPEDLLGDPGFIAAAERELLRLLPATRGRMVIVGLPLARGDALFNAAALLVDGRWVDSYFKATLPNYGVFDEKRYFRPGLRCPVYRAFDLAIGLNVCEDIWAPRGVPWKQSEAGARLLLNLSASPYHRGKRAERDRLLRHRARTHRAAIGYVNLVGGQDELVFDGDSVFVDARGEMRGRARQFEEELLVADLDESWFATADDATSARESEPFVEPLSESIAELYDQLATDTIALEIGPTEAPTARISVATPATDRASATAAAGVPAAAPRRIHVSEGVAPLPVDEAEVYAALRLGLRDYARKNRFERVVLGLSGGIDSALTAVIAADALGAENVLGVSMPSRWNSEGTKAGAAQVASNLGMPFLELPIEELLAEFRGRLASRFDAAPAPAGDVTDENLQARIRAVLLMALSNREGRLLLTTGNKSELAVGYCTLYGDMAGGFSVLKDVPKTLVYRLAQHRNGADGPIPEDTLVRAPSAELRANQVDQDSLPPYDLLDSIIEAKVEREESAETLVRRGLDPLWVARVYRWIDANEYKRRQSAPGVKITPRAFGRDRRYPITNAYRWDPQSGSAGSG